MSATELVLVHPDGQTPAVRHERVVTRWANQYGRGRVDGVDARRFNDHGRPGAGVDVLAGQLGLFDG